jgi:hypothetical protein
MIKDEEVVLAKLIKKKEELTLPFIAAVRLNQGFIFPAIMQQK